MNQAKILLLDFNPVGELGKKLVEILEIPISSNQMFQLDVTYRQEFVRNDNLTFFHHDLSNHLFRSRLDLVFLVFPSNFLNRANTILSLLKKDLSELPIIVVMETDEPGEPLELLKLGATDFITPPLKGTEILPRIWRLLDQTHPEEMLIQRLKEKLGLKQLIGENSAFLAEIKKIPLLARCDAGVLICGETGTGKEVCARAIHYLSPRANKPFIPINCGAIPSELVENELFGHARGAFTGASTSQPGLIEEADGGTVFLDEIDSLPLLVQVKLLRFLQEKEYRPLGSTRFRKANVRILAATNTNLEEAVREGKLRQDLYYRLNVIPLVLPPLRERQEDIPLLARHFLAKYATEFNKPTVDFSSEALQRLTFYIWPGNVRELEHVIQRAVLLSERRVIQSTDIALPGLEASLHEESFQEAKARIIEQFEKTYIQNLLFIHHGNITRAAKVAQKNRRAFWQLVRKHHIDVESFRSKAS
jgi:DNA-binding NtrC family response regulator